MRCTPPPLATCKTILTLFGWNHLNRVCGCVRVVCVWGGPSYGHQAMDPPLRGRCGVPLMPIGSGPPPGLVRGVPRRPSKARDPPLPDKSRGEFTAAPLFAFGCVPLWHTLPSFFCFPLFHFFAPCAPPGCTCHSLH